MIVVALATGTKAASLTDCAKKKKRGGNGHLHIGLQLHLAKQIDSRVDIVAVNIGEVSRFCFCLLAFTCLAQQVASEQSFLTSWSHGTKCVCHN